MKNQSTLLKEKALNVLHQATCKYGILALPDQGTEVENYTRVWARDSIMAGLVGLDYKDTILIDGLKNSLNTLKNHQSTFGIIPSNVSISKIPKVSYGGTAGRVDATLWYIIGVLKYLEYNQDNTFKNKHLSHLRKALDVCTIWEFNHKHLIYTPLSGNWADEYPIHGYTLYDNCLRLWGLELYSVLIEDDDTVKDKVEQVRLAIKSNFLLNNQNQVPKYHSLLYDRTIALGSKPYFAAGFNPSRYFTMFDAGGNGLALMLGLMEKEEVPNFTAYLSSIFKEIKIDLMPAFWPVIDDTHELYSDLKSNFAYSFKNHPYHFHNGGIWPIMNGWLAKGLSKYGENEIVEKMKKGYLKIAQKEDFKFSEYISSDSLQPGGKAPLCYSASGALMLLNL